MRTLHLRKFSDLYAEYGLSAVKNLHLMVQLLLLGRTVNLWKLKDYVGMALGKADVEQESHYRRLTRFFDTWGNCEGFVLDVQKHSFKVLRRLRFSHLLLDGTSWTRGKQKYHYMVLSVLAGSVAIPIYWKQLSKIGSSNQREREELMAEVLKHFNLKGMTLLADREYIGKKWFKLLKENKIDFVIRLRFGDYYEAVDAALGKTYQQMYDKCFLHRKFVRKHILLDGNAYFIAMRPNPKNTPGEEVIIFLTLIRPVRKTVDQYIKRWRIECFFRHVKTNGFNLEQINLRSVAKSNLMMAVVCLAYTITIRAAWKTQKLIRKITFADESVFPAQSVFRRGLALVAIWCASLDSFVNYLHSLFENQNYPFVKNVQ
ncbi:MAG: transposase [Lewinellaceae bacterium]|nr:transposase [Lewinellaceae bacterium]